MNAIWKMSCFAAMTVALPLLIGCGADSDNGKLQAVVPATLRVMHKGKALVDAVVVLHPTKEEKTDKWPARPRGLVDAEGIAKLSSYHTGDGAPPGEYIVTVVAAQLIRMEGEEEIRGKDSLGGRFATPKVSRLRVSIAKGDPGPHSISLD